MFRHPVRALFLMALLCGTLQIAIAQTSALPDTPPPATTPLSTTPAPTTPAKPDPPHDDSITPPPAVQATLPEVARRSSLMIKRGDRELEWRMSLSHFSSNTVFIEGVAMLPVMVVGQVAVQSTRKDMLINSFAAHYGLRDNLEGELKVPFRAEYDRNSVPDANPPTETTASAIGLGDIDGSLYYQLPQKNENKSRYILTTGIKSATGRDLFALKSPTDIPLGTGFWSSKVGVTCVTVSDPAAIFWNVDYTYNWLRRNIRVVSTDSQTQAQTVSYVNIKPGNTFDFGGGFAYALNTALSINTGAAFSVNAPSTSNGKKLANTAITSASLRLGAVWMTEKGYPIDLSVSMGLTRDSPDFTLEWRRNFKWNK